MSHYTAPPQDIIGYLIGRTSLTQAVPLPVAEKVIRHQFKAAAIATQQHSTVELSGMGYLYVSEKKLKAKLSRAKSILSAYNIKLSLPLSEVKRASLLKRIDSINTLIERYESRLERTCAGNL